MQIEGELIGKFPIQQITETFQKRDFVIRTIEQYPQEILIELTQNRVFDIDQIPKGTNIRVDINIRGRRWIDKEGNTRFSNSIQAWKITQLGGVHMETRENDFPDPPAEMTAKKQEEEDDDLPY